MFFIFSRDIVYYCYYKSIHGLFTSCYMTCRRVYVEIKYVGNALFTARVGKVIDINSGVKGGP